MNYFFAFCIVFGVLFAECSACCCEKNGNIIFEADLTTGESFIAPGYGTVLSTPITGSGTCSKQGVATITFPTPAIGQPQKRQLTFDLYFNTILMDQSDHAGWNFNIGDSTNNGYGGDAGHTSNAAEVHNIHRKWYVYSNTLPGYENYGQSGLLIDTVADAITEHVTVTIGDEYVQFDNHADFQKCYKSTYLFTLRGQVPTYGSINYDIFFSMNRVITTTFRSGKGLCKAVIRETTCM